MFPCYSYGPLMGAVWSFDSTRVPWMDQLQSWIKYIFSNSYRWGREMWLSSREHGKELKAIFFYAQHILLFLSIMLNWSIEGNLPYVDETAGNDRLAGESIFRTEFKPETSGIQRSDSHYTVMLNLGRCGFWYWIIDKMNSVLKRIRTAYTKFLSGHAFFTKN